MVPLWPNGEYWPPKSGIVGSSPTRPGVGVFFAMLESNIGTVF